MYGTKFKFEAFGNGMTNQKKVSKIKISKGKRNLICLITYVV